MLIKSTCGDLLHVEFWTASRRPALGSVRGATQLAAPSWPLALLWCTTLTDTEPVWSAGES